jgi:hypothetical protein
MVASPMPPGWDLDRIRDRSGDQTATILNTDRRVTAEWSVETLGATAAFGFHNLAVVQLAGDDDWHMGSLDQATGDIHLWASYADFGDALQGL